MTPARRNRRSSGGKKGVFFQGWAAGGNCCKGAAGRARRFCCVMSTGEGAWRPRLLPSACWAVEPASWGLARSG